VRDPWPAPTAARPVDGTVELPGSKSLTNRALVLAALADGASTLRRPLRSWDTDAMAGALRTLGTDIIETADGWSVRPGPLTGPANVDCGLAGTVARFLPAVAALARGPVVIDGAAPLRARPLAPLVAALQTLGAQLTAADGGRLPLTVDGTGGLSGGAVAVDASGSSQFVSGLLLAAPRFDRGVTVRHRGGPLPHPSYAAMTVDLLRRAGAQVDDTAAQVWTVAPGRLDGLDLAVEPDLNNAAPFLAAAVVTGGRVTVAGWPAETHQPGALLADLLAGMGASVRQDGSGLTVAGGDRIGGLDADLHDAGELLPVLTALAALADSPSRFSGVAHLRGHETDRLAALAGEWNRLGGDVQETADGLVVRPRPLHGGVVETYHDHRLATAAAVLGLAVPGICIRDVGTTAKTLPGFVERWTGLVGEPA